jgi:hypothetical protein
LIPIRATETPAHAFVVYFCCSPTGPESRRARSSPPDNASLPELINEAETAAKAANQKVAAARAKADELNADPKAAADEVAEVERSQFQNAPAAAARHAPRSHA